MSDPFRFRHGLRVRWGECDAQGIVFNPNYMLFCDVAFTEYWREIGFVYPQALQQDGLDNFMVSARIDFRAPARYDDMLDIGVRTASFGRTSFRVAFDLRRGGEAVAAAEASYVIADLATRRPCPVPESLRAAVAGFETTPPEQRPPGGRIS